MRVSIGLRNENDEIDNTWYSNAHRDPDSTVQLHITRELYVALGSPPFIRVTIDPDTTEDDR